MKNCKYTNRFIIPFVLIIAIVGIQACCAQVKQADRSELLKIKDSGIAAFASGECLQNLLGGAKNWTSDFAGVFTQAEQDSLNRIIANYEKATFNQIAIVTLDSNCTSNENFDKLIFTIHNKWGVGKKEKNNGILIGISMSLRKIRISNGYGIEEKLTDAMTKSIIDDIIIPQFKEGNYYKGVNLGLLAIFKALE